MIAPLRLLLQSEASFDSSRLRTARGDAPWEVELIPRLGRAGIYCVSLEWQK